MHRQRAVRVFAVDANKLMKKPDLSKPAKPEKKLFGDEEADAAAAPSVPMASTGPSGVNIEYQRQRAKEMTKFFQEKKTEQQNVQSQRFGWTAKNEISNGRWVMFGLLVGMLTEFATGVSFIDQLKLMITYLGIADLE